MQHSNSFSMGSQSTGNKLILLCLKIQLQIQFKTNSYECLYKKVFLDILTNWVDFRDPIKFLKMVYYYEMIIWLT